MSRTVFLQIAVCLLCVSSGFTQEPTFPVVNPENYWLTGVPGEEGCGIYEHNGENHLFGIGWWDDETQCILSSSIASVNTNNYLGRLTL